MAETQENVTLEPINIGSSAENSPEGELSKPIDVTKAGNKSKKRPVILLALLISLALILVGAIIYIVRGYQINLENEVVTEMSIPQTLTQGKLIIGTDATFPPMEFIDVNSNLVGYDVDLGRRIAEELNLQVEFRNIAWDMLFDSLSNGEIDMIISSVTITDERKLTYLFSKPYINAGQVIIVRSEESSITSTDDLQGKKIAVQRGTTNEQQALNFTSKESVLTFDDFIGATEALVNKEADAVFSDLTGAKGIIDANPSLTIASDPFTSEFYGIVLRKEQDGMIVELNSALDSLRQRGVLVFLKQKWL